MAQMSTTTSPAIVNRDIALSLPQIWWGPVTAGAVSAIAAQLFFTVLGLAIGVSSANGNSETAEGIGIAAGVWWLISGTIALLLGGLVLGRLMGRTNKTVLGLHALAMWALVTLFGFLVIWSGAGMATDAASPIAALAGERDTRSPLAAEHAVGSDITGITGSESLLAGNNAVNAEAARDAAQTASWWSVVGLLLGVGASVAGTVISTRPVK